MKVLITLNRNLQLAFWDELGEDDRQRLYDELNELDLDDVVQSFQRCLSQAEDQKLDDRMTPLPPSICGSILTATNQVQLSQRFSFANTSTTISMPMWSKDLDLGTIGPESHERLMSM